MSYTVTTLKCLPSVALRSAVMFYSNTLCILLIICFDLSPNQYCPINYYCVCIFFVYIYSAAVSIFMCSINQKEALVDLSLLSVDTGKPDVLPESLGLPLRLVGEEKTKHDTKRKRKLSESQQVINSLQQLHFFFSNKCLPRF